MPPLPRYRTHPQILDHACEVLRNGGTRIGAASAIRVHVTTLENWIAEDAAVRDRVERAEQERDAAGARPALLAPPRARPAPGDDRWAKVCEDAALLGPGLYGLYLWVDAALVVKGFPPTSPWWLWILSAFWTSGLRWLVLLVGRGGGKSSTLCRVAVVEALFGERSIPPGQTWLWPFISVIKADARRRLDEIQAILEALGVQDVHRSAPDGMPTLACKDAAGNSIAFVSIAATIAGVSGPSAVGFTGDEASKWRDEDTGANPADQVLKSAVQMFRARAGIHGYLCSSAWTESGPHHEWVKAGTTSLRFVARLGVEGLRAALDGFARAAAFEVDSEKRRIIEEHAASLTVDSTAVPTFVANPTIDPVMTRIEEPDIYAWLREVASVPTGVDVEALFFDTTLLAEAARLEPQGIRGPCFAALDPASRANAAALAIVRRVETKVGWQWVPVVLQQWKPAPGRPLDLRLVVLPEMARLCVQHGVTDWVTDVHALTDVEIVGRQHGLLTRCRAEGDAFEQEYRPVRDAIHRGECPLSGCDGADELVRQLRLVCSAPGGAGHTRILSPEEGRLHGDLQRAYVSAAAEAGAGTYQAPSKDHGIGAIPGRYTAVDPRR